MALGPATMTFRYSDSFQEANNLEAYEHLILQVMLNNQALFTRSDGIERPLGSCRPLLEHPSPIATYPKGSWGPESSELVVAPVHWTLPESAQS